MLSKESLSADCRAAERSLLESQNAITPDKANQEHGRLNEGLQFVLKQRRKKKSPVMYRGGLQCLIITCSL